jgi:hypothetical protein
MATNMCQRRATHHPNKTRSPIDNTEIKVAMNHVKLLLRAPGSLRVRTWPAGV